MSAPQRLVIVGAGEFAEIAYEYFTHDSPHTVVAFAVERPFLTVAELYGLPVVPLDELPVRHPPAEHAAFVAVTYTHLNRVRARLFRETRAMGYQLATYVSSRAFVWHNVALGDNCFVFEHAVLQHHARLGDDVIVWAGGVVAHRAVVGDHAFLASKVALSGFCEIGAHSFVGANACVADCTRVAADCIVGMGAVVVRDTEPGRVYAGNPARALARSSFETFGVPEASR